MALENLVCINKEKPGRSVCCGCSPGYFLILESILELLGIFFLTQSFGDQFRHVTETLVKLATGSLQKTPQQGEAFIEQNSEIVRATTNLLFFKSLFCVLTVTALASKSKGLMRSLAWTRYIILVIGSIAFVVLLILASVAVSNNWGKESSLNNRFIMLGLKVDADPRKMWVTALIVWALVCPLSFVWELCVVRASIAFVDQLNKGMSGFEKNAVPGENQPLILEGQREASYATGV